MIREEIQYLFDRGMFGMKMGLKNILDLLDYYKIDNNKLNTVHIAGTNGKGSTANIIAQVLTANGYKTGLFTSPHLERFNERIKIDDIEISDEDLAEYIIFFKDGIEKFNCTFFEANTAIVFKYFLDKNVDVAVIETGLGGRFDSTNIVTPIVSVITGIDFDHQKQLGNSIVQIAREKAGIIKRHIPVVANFRRLSVLKVFKSFAKKMKSELNIVKKNKYRFIRENNDLYLEFNFMGKNLRSKINLKGTYQKDNLRTALTALKIISKKYPLNADILSGALSKIYVKGRMEVISKEPLILIDSAHNIEGLSFLKNELKNRKYKEIYLIIGMVKDKDYEKTLKLISDIKARKYFVEAENKRMLDIETVKKSKYIAGDKTIKYFKTPKSALDDALKDYRKGEIVVVTGSHFVIGDLLNELNKI